MDQGAAFRAQATTIFMVISVVLILSVIASGFLGWKLKPW